LANAQSDVNVNRMWVRHGPVLLPVSDLKAADQLGVCPALECGATQREAGRRKAWEKILQTNADEVFCIGTVNGMRQPIVVGPKIRNVPPRKASTPWIPAAISGFISPIHSGSHRS